VISVCLSLRHGASSGCRWRNGLYMTGCVNTLFFILFHNFEFVSKKVIKVCYSWIVSSFECSFKYLCCCVRCVSRSRVWLIFPQARIANAHSPDKRISTPSSDFSTEGSTFSCTTTSAASHGKSWNYTLRWPCTWAFGYLQQRSCASVFDERRIIVQKGGIQTTNLHIHTQFKAGPWAGRGGGGA
jgi:hypothetical protein